MVNSSPLLRKRIVKKYKARFVRFESDNYRGSLAPSWRRPRGIYYVTQVLTTESEEDSEDQDPCLRLVMLQTTPPSTTSPTDLRSSLSRVSRISIFC